MAAPGEIQTSTPQTVSGGQSGVVIDGSTINPNTNQPIGTQVLGPISFNSNVSVAGNITADTFIGNVSGNVANSIHADFANIANTVSQNAQPNITSVGSLTGLNVVGNVSITGNLTATGNTTYVNVQNIQVEDPIVLLGGGPNGAPLTMNDGKDRGAILQYYTTQPVSAFMGWDNSNAEFTFGSNVSISNEIVTYNELGNVRANNFIGTFTGNATTANYASYAGEAFSVNGANVVGAVALATTANTANSVAGANVIGDVAGANHANIADTANSVAGANVSGQVANALVAGTVYTANQPNITQVGTLSSLSVSGNVTASYYFGNGSQLSGVQTSNHAVTANTVVDAAQPNITSVGALTTLALNGSITSNFSPNPTAFYSLGNTSNKWKDIWLSNSIQINGQSITANATSIIFSGNIVGSVEQANYANIANSVSGSNVQGPVTYATTANSVSGSNVSGPVAYATTANSVAGANVQGEVAFAATANSVAGANVSGQVANALVAGTVYTNAQPNITSVGTLSTISVSGNALFGPYAAIYPNASFVLGTQGNTGNIGTIRMVSSGGVNYIQSGLNTDSNSNADLRFTTVLSGQTWMTLTANGNLGIGNTTPQEKLVVNGAANVTGNVTGQYFLGNGALLTGISAGSGNSISNGTSNVNIATANGNVTFGVSGNANVVTVTGSSVQFGTGSGGNISNVNYVTANFFQGNGSLLTGVVGQVANGTSNINIPAANGSITFNVAGNSNVVVISGTSLTAGNLKTTATDIALGLSTGTPGSNTIAIGYQSTINHSQPNCVGIGGSTIQLGTGVGVVGIGKEACKDNASDYSIGIGYLAIQNGNNAKNQIVINASGTALNGAGANTFSVKPIRLASNTNALFYNATTGEITYDTTANITSVGTLSTLSVAGNTNIGSSILLQAAGGHGIFGQSANTGSGGTLRLTTSANVVYIQTGTNLSSNSAAPLVFSTIFNGAEWARIDANGNVGINIASPTSKLHVSGTANVTGAVVLGNTLSTTGNVSMASSSVFKFGVYTVAGKPTSGSVGQVISLSDSTPGGMLAYWDTTNSRWSYVHDNSAV